MDGKSVKTFVKGSAESLQKEWSADEPPSGNKYVIFLEQKENISWINRNEADQEEDASTNSTNQKLCGSTRTWNETNCFRINATSRTFISDKTTLKQVMEGDNREAWS